MRAGRLWLVELLRGSTGRRRVHVCCVIDADGAVADRFSFTHDAAAIRSMVQRLRAAGADRVAIERGDGPVVEELLAAGFAVFVVPGRQIKGQRTRYGSAGNKDRFDAYVLADTLRADGHRWKLLRPDTEPTKALRAPCRSRKDLVETRVQVLGQLRANLELAFPGAIGLFTKPASGISLAFLRRFPTSGKAAWLSPARMANWLRCVGYTGGIGAVVLHGRLTAAAPGLTGPEGEARGQITLALVAMLDVLNEQVRALDIEIAAAFAAHPDQHIFASLPRSGTIRAASLLAEIGDCRERFPTNDALAALAGACPSTRQSGKRSQAVFRSSCSKKLRAAVMDFANGSRMSDPWAAAIYQAAVGRGCRHPHAIRILARAWLRVIWRCWQDGTAFDPALHRGRHAAA